VKALQIQRFGSLDDLELRDVPQPSLPAGYVRIAVEAAGVNPSDVAVAMGRFPQVTLPRTLGRDFAGRVIEGPKELIGRAVWGSGGATLGITQDGTHAEQVVLPQEAAIERPFNLSAQEAAAVGVPYVTAWSALVDLGGFRSGQWALVAGAAGAVGTAAASLARALGGHAIGVVRAETDVSALRELGAEVLRSDDDIEGAVRERTGGRGVDVALNGVGAALFAPLAASLAHGGRMIVYSVIGGRETQLDLFSFYRRELRCFGLDTASLDLTRIRAIYEELTPLFGAGAIAPLRIASAVALSQARAAYESVQRGVSGKVVLLPEVA
jgi:NADPH:quinone reductase-like Zn-dependent oxidoreductase